MRALELTFTITAAALLAAAGLYALEQLQPGLWLAFGGTPALPTFLTSVEPVTAVLATGSGAGLLVARLSRASTGWSAAMLAILVQVPALWRSGFLTFGPALRDAPGSPFQTVSAAAWLVAFAGLPILLGVCVRRFGWRSPLGLAALLGLPIFLGSALWINVTTPGVLISFLNSTVPDNLAFHDTMMTEIMPTICVAALMLAALVARTPDADMSVGVSASLPVLGLVTLLAGATLTITGTLLGLAGMPVRFFDYPDAFARWMVWHAGARLVLVSIGLALLLRPRLSRKVSEAAIFD